MCVFQHFSSVWIPINIYLFISLRVGSSLMPKHASLEATLGSHLQPLWSEFLSSSCGISSGGPSSRDTGQNTPTTNKENFHE